MGNWINPELTLKNVNIEMFVINDIFFFATFFIWPYSCIPLSH